MSKKVPSPCVDVCKFKLEGRCIGCAMTKKQKKQFKSLKKRDDKLVFLARLMEDQKVLGRHDYWRKVYLKKCAKKDIRPPIAA